MDFEMTWQKCWPLWGDVSCTIPGSVAPRSRSQSSKVKNRVFCVRSITLSFLDGFWIFYYYYYYYYYNQKIIVYFLLLKYSIEIHILFFIHLHTWSLSRFYHICKDCGGVMIKYCFLCPCHFQWGEEGGCIKYHLCPTLVWSVRTKKMVSVWNVLKRFVYWINIFTLVYNQKI